MFLKASEKRRTHFVGISVEISETVVKRSLEEISEKVTRRIQKQIARNSQRWLQQIICQTYIREFFQNKTQRANHMGFQQSCNVFSANFRTNCRRNYFRNFLFFWCILTKNYSILTSETVFAIFKRFSRNY